MAASLTSSDFSAHLHTAFRVQEPVELELELTAVEELSTARLEQFSVYFKGPEEPWLRQGTYRLFHPAMQEIALFLVPLGPEGGSMRYEAAFSRFVHPPSASAGAV